MCRVFLCVHVFEPVLTRDCLCSASDYYCLVLVLYMCVYVEFLFVLLVVVSVDVSVVV